MDFADSAALRTLLATCQAAIGFDFTTSHCVDSEGVRTCKCRAGFVLTTDGGVISSCWLSRYVGSGGCGEYNIAVTWGAASCEKCMQA